MSGFADRRTRIETCVLTALTDSGCTPMRVAISSLVQHCSRSNAFRLIPAVSRSYQIPKTDSAVPRSV